MMRKLLNITCAIALLSVFIGCQNTSNPGDSSGLNPGTDDPETVATDPVLLPFVEQPDSDYVSALTGTIEMTNEGPASLTVYAGEYASTAASRVVRASVTIPANSTGTLLPLADMDRQNLWFVRDDEPDTVYRMTTVGLLALFKLSQWDGYVLTFSYNADYDYYSWDINFPEGSYPLDWTTPAITSLRASGDAATYQEGYLSAPTVNLLNSPDWALDGDGAYFAQKSDYSAYMYGTIRLRYAGTGQREFVRITYRVRNADNSIRYLGYTYAYAKAVILSTTGETDTAVLATGDLARFLFIDDLSEYGFLAGDISAVDLFVSSSSYGGTVPTPLAYGDAVWTSGTNGYIPVTNTTANPITRDTLAVFFADSSEREYFWDYPMVYQQNATTGTWSYSPNALPAGATGRITFTNSGSSFFTETYHVAQLSDSWDGRSLASLAASGSVGGASAEPDRSADMEDCLADYNAKATNAQSLYLGGADIGAARFIGGMNEVNCDFVR